MPKRRSPRETRTFESEAEARTFAREKFNEGLILFAGTLNPFLPRRLIPSSDIPSWIEQGRGKPTLMLFSVVDDRSGVVYDEYRCVYGEDAESALRFLFNAMAPKPEYPDHDLHG